MERSYRAADVLCPFYRDDDSRQRKIRCEGLIEGSSLTHYFRKKTDYEQQLKIFCCANYSKCEVASLLLHEKYEE